MNRRNILPESTVINGLVAGLRIIYTIKETVILWQVLSVVKIQAGETFMSYLSPSELKVKGW